MTIAISRIHFIALCWRTKNQLFKFQIIVPLFIYEISMKNNGCCLAFNFKSFVNTFDNHDKTYPFFLNRINKLLTICVIPIFQLNLLNTTLFVWIHRSSITKSRKTGHFSTEKSMIKLTYVLQRSIWDLSKESLNMY